MIPFLDDDGAIETGENAGASSEIPADCVREAFCSFSRLADAHLG